MAIKSRKDLFRIHQWIWKFSGFVPPQNYRIAYSFWIFVVAFGIMIFYPIHLVLGLIKVRTNSEVFGNLSISIADVQFSIKYFIIWYNLKNIRLVEEIFTTMDARMQTQDEIKYFRKIIRTCMQILYGIGIVDGTSGIASELSILVATERRLIFPAWFPFDWQLSNVNYWMANMYQFLGLTVQIITTYSSDTYTTLTLATLSGHIRLLAMRVAKLGTDPRKTLKENNEELRVCIKDHANLIRLYQVLSNLLSVIMFFQILFTGINMSCTIMYLTFYADNAMSFLYSCLNLTALCLEIYPICYFGTIFEIEFNNLPYALFSCNWVDQDREFKQNMFIFSQRGLQKTEFICMGFFKINLDSFVATVKSAYSLLSVIVQVK